MKFRTEKSINYCDLLYKGLLVTLSNEKEFHQTWQVTENKNWIISQQNCPQEVNEVT